MAVKVVHRNSIIKEVRFGQVLIGDMFAFNGELYIKSDVNLGIKIMSDDSSSANASSCTKKFVLHEECYEVDVKIEWCAKSSV